MIVFLPEFNLLRLSAKKPVSQSDTGFFNSATRLLIIGKRWFANAQTILVGVFNATAIGRGVRSGNGLAAF